jgi:hypothetical protein
MGYDREKAAGDVHQKYGSVAAKIEF